MELYDGIRSLTRVRNFTPGAQIRALPPSRFVMTLYLNIFRGEPAISGFDWHFTSYHSSSEPLTADTGAVLRFKLMKLQPDHGKLTRFRVYQRLQKFALFRLAFTLAA